jgi:hypothetical protein
MGKSWLKIIGVLAIMFIIIQFIPVEKSNPTIVSEIPSPAEVQKILKRSCYDCHSHQTVWPWYSHIAPVSWFIAHDVKEGRKHLNFSAWSQYDQRKQYRLYEEIQEVIAEEEMPLKPYIWLHPSAKLTEDDKMVIKEWLIGNRPESRDFSAK